MNHTIVLEGEIMYEKIQKLKQLKIDGENWLTFYVDDANGDKWVQEYPHSAYHGGGSSQLKLLDKFPWEISK